MLHSRQKKKKKKKSKLTQVYQRQLILLGPAEPGIEPLTPGLKVECVNK